MYSLIVVEAGSPKSRCQPGGFLLEALRGSIFHVSPGFWRLWAVLAFLGWRLSPRLRLHLYLAFSPVPVCLKFPSSVSYKGAGH